MTLKKFLTEIICKKIQGGHNKNFFLICASLGLSKVNENFVGFLSSNFGYKILTENKIIIHIETGNVYFDKRNTNESCYYFFTTQQDKKKKLINTYKFVFAISDRKTKTSELLSINILKLRNFL